MKISKPEATGNPDRQNSVKVQRDTRAGALRREKLLFSDTGLRDLIIPLVLEHKQNADAAEYCKEYLNLFPNGKYVTEVKTWLSQAQ